MENTIEKTIRTSGTNTLSHNPWKVVREQQDFCKTTDNVNKFLQPGLKRLSQNIQTKHQQDNEADVSSSARESHVYGEKSSQGESLLSKGIWEVPKTMARSVQFFKEPIPIQTTNRFNPLRENAFLDTEKGVPCKLSHLSHASDPHTCDKILSQGGEMTDPKGPWQIPKTRTSAKSFENKTATNEDNHYAEAMNWATARSEINIVPSKHLYSEAVKMRKNENHEINCTPARSNPWENQPVGKIKKPTISIVGDSMLRNVRKRAFSREIRHFSSYVKTFPGATVDHMKSYLEPTISMQPDGIIIMCGTNNLRRETPQETANKIIKLAVETKRRVKNVAVSAIIKRADSEQLEWKRKQVNQLVDQGLKTNEISFIKHDNIQIRHLDHWGLHLNMHGSNILTGNFINFLKGV